jgi:pyruvate/2-oxoglutarate dehydrogenase complex dihydrolipoamide acyltransferase (E2) component
MRKTYVIVGPSKTHRDELRAYAAEKRVTKERPIVRIVDVKQFTAVEVEAFVHDADALIFEAFDAETLAHIEDCVAEAFEDSRDNDDMARGVRLLDDFCEDRPTVTIMGGDPLIHETQGPATHDVYYPPADEPQEPESPADVVFKPTSCEGLRTKKIPPRERPNAVLSAVALADDLGIDIWEVGGTGKDGRVLKSDVERHVTG